MKFEAYKNVLILVLPFEIGTMLELWVAVQVNFSSDSSRPALYV